jgi:hypothetical protein
MPDTQRHTIRRQFLEVEIDGGEQAGTALHRTLPDLCARLLAPAIERVLNRHAPHGVLSIERLDIDAGNVSLNELSDKLPSLVADALEHELKKIPTGDAANTRSISLSDTVRLRTLPETLIEAFLFFLENGTLPWSFNIAPGSGLEPEIARAFRDASPAGSLPANIKSALFETLRSPVARQRLVRQFSPAFIKSIPDLFSAEARQLLKRLILAPGKAPATGRFTRPPERRLLEEALNCVVSGVRLTETSLLAVLQSTPSASGDQKAEPEKAPGDTQKEQTLSPEAARIGKSRNDAPLEDASGQQDSDSETKSGGKPGATTGNSDHRSDDKTLPESAPENLSGPAAHTKPPGKSDDLTRHRDHESSGQHESVSESEDGDKSPSGVDKKISTPGESSLTEPHGEMQSKQSGAASSIEKDRVSEKRESVARRKLISDHEHPDAKTGLYIDHAGLVLLHPFLPQFFGRLGITDGGALVMPNRALYLLHSLATGEWSAPEYELPVMKVLCGLPLEFVAEPAEALKPEEDEEVTALLSAVIRHWEALKNTSPGGLREAFLKRSGKLSLKSDGEWLLQAEPKGFDILLDQLPWGISMIRLPWMPNMLRVEWCS